MLKNSGRIICLGKFFLAAMVSLGLLNLFVLRYSFSGVHITNETHATDYVWEPNQIKRTMTEGFASIQMDELGYNNLSVPENIDYLVMGSSQVEGANVETEENFVALLNEEYEDVNFYNIGISGHTIYNCVNNLEYAVENFLPSRAIILVTDDIELDIESMEEVICGEWERIPSYDTGMLYNIQKKLPVIKTLYKKVSEWMDSEQTEEASYAETSSQFEEYQTVLQQFLLRAGEEAGDVELMIVYQPQTSINDDGSFNNGYSQNSLDLFESVCKNCDIKFVDMTADFKELYEKEHRLAHGFTNTGVGSGHLNRYGHQAMAKRISEVIKGESE